jgi:hypothetical protein
MENPTVKQLSGVNGVARNAVASLPIMATKNRLPRRITVRVNISFTGATNPIVDEKNILKSHCITRLTWT